MNNEDYKKILPKQIASLRTKKGLTQQQLADKLDVSKQTISNWENGVKVPRMGAIEQIASIFNVSKSFIIEGKDNVDDELPGEVRAMAREISSLASGDRDLLKAMIQTMRERGKKAKDE
ncbi:MULTISPECIES: helix-turn-helix domain-containing protein [Bacillus cereus group]|uniref:helix-turn-helix domain-containing protein n=1 Tax=Bacillus cereus group TaxID=86661 RepID=UPI000BEF32DD|nr:MULTISPECIES: helix-turn-helix transcriptional regulator [Bacillus cereus group]PEM87328.1 transcriptional regulator [Bacillus toyonensis]PEQ69707.1 transcriptional regulator [Bacillus thuringiensis]